MYHILFKKNHNYILKNYKIKLLLVEHFQDDLSFVDAKPKNRSQLFSYNKNVKAIIQNIYDLQNNSIDECAKIFKKYR